MADKLAIIVAGGSGSRMGASVPKQFLDLGGRPVLMRTVDAFAAVGGMRVVLVLPRAHIGLWQELCRARGYASPADLAEGGRTRFESVRNGLGLWRGERLVGVHDGVRPLVSRETIERCYADADRFGTAVPALAAVESVRIVSPDGGSRAVDRRQVMMVQTPQVFRAKTLLDAYTQPESPLFTDDASVVEAMGAPIHLTVGQPGNIKLTTPGDMRAAEAALRSGAV